MAATYKQFLAAPSSSLLADTAALYYVTTTTTFAGPTEIIKHLNGLQKVVSKKKEEIFNLVDAQNVAVFEIDTGLGFKTGGGPYLPGLDDNFLAARDVYLPITHFVTFDESGKISQIRLQWDQGSLLKQVEVIGKSGRNWPIRDSREQITFIRSCLKSAGTMPAAPPSHNESVARTRGNSNNALRDPHASLRLFGPRDEIEAGPDSVVSPYAGNRPRQRSFTEILGDEPDSPSAGRQQMSPAKAGGGKNFQPMRIFDGHDEALEEPPRSTQMSPAKGGHGKNFQPMRIFDGHEEALEEPRPRNTQSPAKAGGGKNFQPSRIFDGHEEAQAQEEPQPQGKRYIRPNPKKFSHFDFADGTDEQDQPQRGQSFDEKPKSKHDSQWSFQDFVTPQKAKPSRTMRAQDVRHWDTDKDAMDPTPAKPAVKPRRDAESHFELLDDGERVPQPPRPGAKPRGQTHNEGLGLYKNQLFDDEEPETNQRALGNITNVKDRGKDFDHHFDITDESPVPQQPAHVPEGRKKAVQMMDSNWSMYDKSPVSQKENRPTETEASGDNRIHIAGDGMGGRKGTNRDWLYGETQDIPQSIPGRKPNAAASAGAAGVPLDKNAKIHIAGDGMGGRKGTNRDWLYGEVEEQPLPTRKQATTSSKKDFWDF
ncbi:hypothetical protein FALBO_8294 [Fusarium albosuccineum]|uniref:Uncharacterized protein n=1 Tax=Fusarium albosuccineum TaxID=1237068 RepID=A0A8H4LB56_9HYPO|nr:hypothetical protein FALBO_8294 [Fusarium albosuccineum]